MFYEPLFCCKQSSYCLRLCLTRTTSCCSAPPALGVCPSLRLLQPLHWLISSHKEYVAPCSTCWTLVRTWLEPLWRVNPHHLVSIANISSILASNHEFDHDHLIHLTKISSNFGVSSPSLEPVGSSRLPFLGDTSLSGWHFSHQFSAQTRLVWCLLSDQSHLVFLSFFIYFGHRVPKNLPSNIGKFTSDLALSRHLITWLWDSLDIVSCLIWADHIISYTPSNSHHFIIWHYSPIQHCSSV